MAGAQTRSVALSFALSPFLCVRRARAAMAAPPATQRGLPTIDEEGERVKREREKEREALACAVAPPADCSRSPSFSTSTSLLLNLHLSPSLPHTLQAVTAAGASVLPDGSGITGLGGWTLEARSAPIAGEAELAAIRARLAAHPAGPAPTLPEQTFAGSYIRASHAASGLVLEFTAAGALEAWLAAGEPPLKVKEAAAWRASRAADIATHAAPTLTYDWTFTAPYGGDLRSDLPTSWAPATRPLDRGVLTARDPILLWAEVPLLESELDDHGSSTTTVRVRAMPGAWFAVARCFVRVDGVAVRLVEARLLVTWDTRGGGGEGGGAPPRITREVRHFAGTFDELRAAGAPGDGPAYADGDAASDALSAVAPVGCVKFETTELKVGCE